MNYLSMVKHQMVNSVFIYPDKIKDLYQYNINVIVIPIYIYIIFSTANS